MSITGVPSIDGLNATSAAVVKLAQSLPHKTHPFNIYMDNFFSNVPLFKHLCDLKIGACGTARINSKQFPASLKVDKKAKHEWDTLSGVVVDNSVLAVVWVDNAPVSMLTTIHKITGSESRVHRLRRCPRTTSSNYNKVHDVFKGQHSAMLDIPAIINDYNHKMNGVDLSDQYRSYYNTQLTVFRTWMPLFFWILDTTIVNSYRIYKAQGGTLSHREYRIELAWALALEGSRNQTPNVKVTRQHHQKEQDRSCSQKVVYVTKNRTELPAIRLTNKGLHYPTSAEGKPNCILCRHKATVLKDPEYRKRTSTSFKCGFCNVPLCLLTRNCYREYHEIPIHHP